MKPQIIIALLAISISAGNLSAQVRQVGRGGRLLDRNSSYGGSRVNSRVPSNYGTGSRGGFFSVSNSRGLTAFRGNLPSIDTQLRVRSINQATSTFRQQSTSVGDILKGRALYDPQNYVYQSRLRTSVNRADILSAQKRGSLVLPGRTTREQTQRDKTTAQLYKQATESYKPLLDKKFKLGSSAIGVEPDELRRLRARYANNLEFQKVLDRRGDQLFGVLREGNRAELAREISELKRSTLFGGEEEKLPESLVKSRLDQQAGRKIKIPEKPKPGDLIRDPETGFLRRLKPGEKVLTKAELEAKRKKMPKEQKDVFLDLLRTLNTKRKIEEKIQKGEKVEPGEETPKTPGSENETPKTDEKKIRNVVMDKKRTIELRNFAGSGSDEFNRYLKQAKFYLKKRRYYSASRKYRLATAMRPQNPLPHLGACMSSFGAGEWLTSATELELAMKYFPPLIEVKLDVLNFVNQADFDARIKSLDQWVDNIQSSPSLLLLACYMNQNRGNIKKAKQYAKEILAEKASTKVQKSYATYVLTGELPGAKKDKKSSAKSDAAKPANKKTGKAK